MSSKIPDDEGNLVSFPSMHTPGDNFRPAGTVREEATVPVRTAKLCNRILTREAVVPLVLGRGGLNLARYLAETSAFYSLDPQRKAAEQLRRLQALVAHAAQHSPHYRASLAAAGVTAADLRSLDDLGRLPRLTKSDLAGESYRELLTGSGSDAERVQTAGTTGLPVTVLKSRAAHARQIANRIFAFERLGLRYGDREARFWGRATGAPPRSTKDRLLNRKIFTFLGETEAQQRGEAESLLRFAPDYFYGYSSLVLRAARTWRELELPRPRLSGIVCTAEMLTPRQADLIAEVFGCPVRMEYGCSEMDIIAMQCSHGAYHVLEHRLLLEIEPAGADAGEAIVTDLDNTLMPMIRYRLGDDLRISRRACPCGSNAVIIESIDGRTLTQLVRLPSGRTVHAVVFAHLFEALADAGYPIHQFRVRQTRLDRFEAQVELRSAADAASLAAEIRRRTIAGLQEEVEVETLLEKVATRPGEKFTYFVPLPE